MIQKEKKQTIRDDRRQKTARTADHSALSERQVFIDLDDAYGLPFSSGCAVEADGLTIKSREK